LYNLSNNSIFTSVVGNHQQFSSTPKTSYKPLASVTPFVPLSNKQQNIIQQQKQQQQQQQPNSTETSKTHHPPPFNREKYQLEGES